MAKPPPDNCSIKIVKSMDYKGSPRPWSNRYFFNGSSTLTTAEFEILADWLAAHEKPCLPSVVTYSEAVGYNGGSEVPVHSKALSGAGSKATTGGQFAPGDAAAVVRFATTARTSKHHPIYLFKYYHQPLWDTSVSADTLLPSQKTALEGFAQDLVDGVSDGDNTRKLSGPYGAVAQSRVVKSFISHRDFRN